MAYGDGSGLNRWSPKRWRAVWEVFTPPHDVFVDLNDQLGKVVLL